MGANKNYNKNCIICGKTFFVPRIHHIDGNKKNNNKKNLLVVCPKCYFSIRHVKKNNRRIFDWNNFLYNNLNLALKKRDNLIYYNLSKGGKKVYV